MRDAPVGKWSASTPSIGMKVKTGESREIEYSDYAT